MTRPEHCHQTLSKMESDCHKWSCQSGMGLAQRYTWGKRELYSDVTTHPSACNGQLQGLFTMFMHFLHTPLSLCSRSPTQNSVLWPNSSSLWRTTPWARMSRQSELWSTRRFSALSHEWIKQRGNRQAWQTSCACTPHRQIEVCSDTGMEPPVFHTRSTHQGFWEELAALLDFYENKCRSTEPVTQFIMWFIKLLLVRTMAFLDHADICLQTFINKKRTT